MVIDAELPVPRCLGEVVQRGEIRDVRIGGGHLIHHQLAHVLHQNGSYSVNGIVSAQAARFQSLERGHDGGEPHGQLGFYRGMDGRVQLPSIWIEARTSMTVLHESDSFTLVESEPPFALGALSGSYLTSSVGMPFNALAHLQGRPTRCARSAHSAAPLPSAAFVNRWRAPRTRPTRLRREA
jgi:hypothetical protein